MRKKVMISLGVDPKQRWSCSTQLTILVRRGYVPDERVVAWLRHMGGVCRENMSRWVTYRTDPSNAERSTATPRQEETPRAARTGSVAYLQGRLDLQPGGLPGRWVMRCVHSTEAEQLERCRRRAGRNTVRAVFGGAC